MEILRTKWAATVAGTWIQCVVGASYTFGIYSPVLKATQGYDQSTLDTVSVFKDIGANAGILSGLLYSSVTLESGGSGVGLGGPCGWCRPVLRGLLCQGEESPPMPSVSTKNKGKWWRRRCDQIWSHHLEEEDDRMDAASKRVCEEE
ncbi:unnamed protein product [Linum tenue]|uniref:Nodulin-like domain-containing protein n=1 Tax=Linum tenue TaxID=586396 RepID=A0AAV0RM43_9ROSI|nr:unnamed protein product [Linum tenue]